MADHDSKLQYSALTDRDNHDNRDNNDSRDSCADHTLILSDEENPPVVTKSTGVGKKKQQLMIGNWGTFFRDLYSYHRYRGKIPYVLRNIRKAWWVICYVLLFGFFTLCFNLHKLLQCERDKEKDSASCQGAFGFFIGIGIKAIDNDGVEAKEQTTMEKLSDIFWIGCNISYWIFIFYLLIRIISRSRMMTKMERFYCDYLKIRVAQHNCTSSLWNCFGLFSCNQSQDDRDKKTDQIALLDWQHVEARVANYADAGKLEPLIKRGKADGRIIAGYTMRYKNFLSALIHSDRCNLNDNNWKYYSEFLTSLLERFVIGGIGRNDFSLKNTDFLGDVDGLKRRLRILGLFAFPAIPFLAIYYILMQSLNFVQQLSSSNNSGSNGGNGNGGNSDYRWSAYAQVKLRKHNEFPHQSKQRLRVNTIFAEQLMECYPNYAMREIVSIIQMPIALAVGFIILSSILFTTLHPNIFFLGRPFIVWLTFLGPILHVSRKYLAAFPKHGGIANMSLEHKQILIRQFVVTGLTTAISPLGKNEPQLANRQADKIQTERANYLYRIENDEGHLNDKILTISNEIKKLYKHRFEIIACDLLGILCLGYVLGWHLHSRAEEILQFLNEKIEMDDDIGVVCKVSDTERQNALDAAIEVEQLLVRGFPIQSPILSSQRQSPTWQSVQSPMQQRFPTYSSPPRFNLSTFQVPRSPNINIPIPLALSPPRHQLDDDKGGDIDTIYR